MLLTSLVECRATFLIIAFLSVYKCDTHSTLLSAIKGPSAIFFRELIWEYTRFTRVYL